VWANDTTKQLYTEFIKNREKVIRSKPSEAFVWNEYQHANTATLVLLDTCAEIIANEIHEDVARYKEVGSMKGLAAKWCPSPNGMHDKSIAMHGRVRDALAAKVDLRILARDLGLVCRVTDTDRILFAKVLSASRRLSQVPESFVGGSKWADVNYQRMPGRCRLVHGKYRHLYSIFSHW
jgi:hypothetical protein